MRKGLFEFGRIMKLSVDGNTTINCRHPVINGENNIGLNLECLWPEPTNYSLKSLIWQNKNNFIEHRFFFLLKADVVPYEYYDYFIGHIWIYFFVFCECADHTRFVYIYYIHTKQIPQQCTDLTCKRVVLDMFQQRPHCVYVTYTLIIHVRTSPQKCKKKWRKE